MVQTYAVDPMAEDLYPKHLCVSDNHTLMELLISYALYVVPTYKCMLFRYNYKLVWRPMVSDTVYVPIQGLLTRPLLTMRQHEQSA